MHVWPGVPKCTLATCEGALMASCDFFKISFHGKSAHCAQAHLGHDALQAAVMMAGRINEIKSQIQEKMILFCGNIHSGEGYNIVPSEAIVGGTVRTFSNDVQKRVVKELEQAAKECAEKVGADYSVEWLGYTAPLNNAPDIVEELAQFLPELNAHAVPSYAAEDFALYQEKVPGVLMWLGTGDTAPLHNECFYVPEEVLYAGVEGWLKIARHTFASGGVEE